MRMRKISMLLATCLMVGTLAGCGSDNSGEKTEGGDNTTNTHIDTPGIEYEFYT